MSNIRVAIIGAGLGGLALGQMLRRAAIDFDIFEADTALDARTQGYRIRIDAQGQHALTQILPQQTFALFKQTASCSSTAGTCLTPYFEPINAARPDSWQLSPQDRQENIIADLSVHRATLRELLMYGIEQHVHFSYALQQYELLDNGQVHLRFATGDYPQQYDVLVAADGVNSKVRNQLIPEATPIDTGSMCIYAKTPLVKIDKYADMYHGTNIVFADGYAAILDEMRFNNVFLQDNQFSQFDRYLSPVEDYFYWAVIGPRQRLGFPAMTQHISSRFIQHNLHELFADWHPFMRDVLAQTDLSSLAALTIRNGQPNLSWGEGPVTLIGDAIHAMSPAGGLGANTALADALNLTAALSLVKLGKQSLQQALKHYENKMRELAIQAIEISNQGAAKLFNSIGNG